MIFNGSMSSYFSSTIADDIVMTQILDSLPTDCASRILCCYINDAHRIKIARITNISNWYFERVVFPGEKLLFQALPEAQLETYVKNYSTVALVEIITCEHLAVKDSQTERKCIAQWRENFADDPDRSFNIAEKFINKESFSSQLLKEP